MVPCKNNSKGIKEQMVIEKSCCLRELCQPMETTQGQKHQK